MESERQDETGTVRGGTGTRCQDENEAVSRSGARMSEGAKRLSPYPGQERSDWTGSSSGHISWSVSGSGFSVLDSHRSSVTVHGHGSRSRFTSISLRTSSHPPRTTDTDIRPAGLPLPRPATAAPSGASPGARRKAGDIRRLPPPRLPRAPPDRCKEPHPHRLPLSDRSGPAPDTPTDNRTAPPCPSRCCSDRCDQTRPKS